MFSFVKVISFKQAQISHREKLKVNKLLLCCLFYCVIIKFCLVFPKIFLLHKVVRDAKKVEKHCYRVCPETSSFHQSCKNNYAPISMVTYSFSNADYLPENFAMHYPNPGATYPIILVINFKYSHGIAVYWNKVRFKGFGYITYDFILQLFTNLRM